MCCAGMLPEAIKKFAITSDQVEKKSKAKLGAAAASSHSTDTTDQSHAAVEGALRSPAHYKLNFATSCKARVPLTMVNLHYKG